MSDGIGHVYLNGKYYRVDLTSYRGRDVVDFAPRASVPSGSVIMSDMSLYQPLYQTDWKHGFGFLWYSDGAGYMNSAGNIDTRNQGIAMLSTQKVLSDTDNNKKTCGAVFNNTLYTGGTNGLRQY